MTSRRLFVGLLAAGVTLPAASAEAARYVARPDGGKIALVVTGGELRRVDAQLPSRCEDSDGQHSWSAPLGMTLSGGSVALQSNRFSFQGEAPNGVKYQLSGRLRGGAISGRLRMTYLDIDVVGFDESYLCDTGTTGYRATRRR
jgi:hypothetical protein